MKRLVLQVQMRSSYGHERIYPMNKTATRLLELIGRKTYFESDFEILRELGFTVQWVQN